LPGESSDSSLLYRFTKLLCLIYLKVVFRLSSTGYENISKNGPMITVANHASYLDAPALAVAFKRQLFFMAKEELFKLPILGIIFRGLSAFPVDRKKIDIRAFRTSLKLLNQGKAIALFPEGTRHRIGHKKLGQLHTGAAYLAIKSKVPLIPVGISGTDKAIQEGKYLPRLSKIFVNIGKPINLDGMDLNQENIKKLTDIIEKEIIKLLV